MKPRKLWSTTVDAVPYARRRHESRAEAYRYVDSDRANYACGALRGCRVSVWVDERDGKGWRLFDRVDFAAEGVAS